MQNDSMQRELKNYFERAIYAREFVAFFIRRFSNTALSAVYSGYLSGREVIQWIGEYSTAKGVDISLCFPENPDWPRVLNARKRINRRGLRIVLLCGDSRSSIRFAFHITCNDVPILHRVLIVTRVADMFLPVGFDPTGRPRLPVDP